ncbi:MAG TPA: Ppx/GppA phosphatase family protein [Candidatus Binataceae bacterium]|nr:Ppx/GppA phosphatase family protein [Candidatus Binataceae bacterium]
MKLAAFDVGTNTVLMLAVEVGDDQYPRVLAELGRIARLGRGVDRTGALDPETSANTLATIEEFARRARELGVGKFDAVATSALRDAGDGDAFIVAVRERTGVELRVISGAEEAALSHLAVMRGLPIDPAGKLLIVDIGGGSTELIRAEPGRPLDLASLQLGSVRLTERMVRGDPPTAAEIAKLRETIDGTLAIAAWDFRPDAVVGIAGTVTTICAVSEGLDVDQLGSTHGRTIALSEVKRVRELFGAMPLTKRRNLPGLAEGRADVIFAGAMILECVLERFHAAAVTVSDQGVRWGLVWRAIGDA